MLSGKTVHKVSTKQDKDSPEVNTTLTLDWEGVSEELVKAIATRQIIVTLQGKFRRDESIPATHTFKVVEYGTRAAEPVTVETTFARASALTEEEQRKLLEQLTANLKPASGRGSAKGGNAAK